MIIAYILCRRKGTLILVVFENKQKNMYLCKKIYAMVNIVSSSKKIDRKFNDDLKVIVKAFKGVSPEKRNIITQPMGKLIESYMREKIGYEVNKSLYAF